MNEIKFTLTNLTVDEVNTILAGLQELPAKFCNPLTAKIRQQAEQQIPRPENTDEIEQVPA